MTDEGNRPKKTTGGHGGREIAAETGSPRASSEETRRRLIGAALDAFGRYGFDGASTRRIASEAGVNLAAIPYHFGGKDGLHRAVAQHIVDEVKGRLGPLVDTISAALQSGEVDAEKARVMLHAMVGQAAEVLLGHPEAQRWAPFILREQMDPSPTFDVIYDGFMGRAHILVTGLLARATGRSEEDPETIARAFALLGQLVIFRMGRAIIERRLGWTGYGPTEIETVKSILQDTVTAIMAEGEPS
ncbi:CerR family C-terminal domain-containing protein [Microbaculum marinum]|uniref:CerR family C-terminal domain-containing protein n=1 Tax=Microbaculum marinum TaxID=1764581 RepID=A0AAW9RLH7_9HYPH